MTTHVGPYIKCLAGKQLLDATEYSGEPKRKKGTCANGHPTSNNAKFCTQCGAIAAPGEVIREWQVPFSTFTVTQEIKESLYEIENGGHRPGGIKSDERFEFHYYGINRPPAGQPRPRQFTFDRDDQGSVCLELETDAPAKEIAYLKAAFKDELLVLEKYYGIGNVVVFWGIIVI